MKYKSALNWGVAVLAMMFMTGTGAAPAAGAPPNVDWRSIGQGADEAHYSPLADINRSTVSRLGLAWSLDLDTTPTATTPLEVDGALYVAAGYSIVHAIDAVSGKLLWRYDPHAPEAAGEKLRYAWGIRGLAYADHTLYVGTIDGRLIALDAHSGQPVWSVLTVAKDDTLNITGAPRVMGDKVIIGNGGADMGLVRGYVTAYDRKTGRQAWRFYTVPGNPADGFENKAMEMAAKTWSGEWWKVGSGGTAWNGITYDPELNQVYIGVGNAGPWNWKIRNPEGKDNLFISSVVALDVNTGAYRWHYQANPNDAWDISAAMDMIAATLVIDGKPRKVLMQAPKNGFFYVLDRQSGKLISAKNIVKVTWASGVDLKTGRPIEAPNIRYESGSSTFWPSYYGGHNWQPMAYSPKTNLVYIPTLEMVATWSDEGIDEKNWKRIPGTINPGINAPIGTPGVPDYAYLLAWDPVHQRKVWQVPAGAGQNPGVLATGGNLVFQGRTDGHIHAYDAQSGKELWSYFAKVCVTGSPITYRVNGRQYMAVVTSPPAGPQSTLARRANLLWSFRDHPRRLLVFTLDGHAQVPETRPEGAITPLDDPHFAPDPAAVERGDNLYATRYCRACHGGDAISGGGAPDLRASPIPTSAEAFRKVVKEGVLVAKGMPQFAELSDDELEAIRSYIRAKARSDLASKTKAVPKVDTGN